MTKNTDGMHLQEHLEECQDLFDDFCRQAQVFIGAMQAYKAELEELRGEEDERD